MSDSRPFRAPPQPRLAPSTHLDDVAPGRSCPLHYLYSPTSLARDAQLHSETLYVVGGLYGNPLALDAVHDLVARENRAVDVVFNGDFHWFDHEPQLFRDISERVLAQHAIRGNVETEFSAEDDTAGCGCAYPEWIDDEVVERSNRIENRLRQTAQRFPDLAQRIAQLPMNLIAQVGKARIAIVHGDGMSLAGWGFSRRSLSSRQGVQRAASWLRAAQVNCFASTHTCEPLCLQVNDRDDPDDVTAGGESAGVIINNGAAGMPNFVDTQFGIITRISSRAANATLPVLYGTKTAGVHIDALALRYDHQRWCTMFEQLWPSGSPAELSYGPRIRNGGELRLAQATR